MNDPWMILGVGRDANADEIKRAYRKLAREHHPDLGGDPDRFRQIQQAYDQINNGSQNPHSTQTPPGFDHFQELFHNLGVRFEWHGRPQRNGNLEIQVELSVADTITGTTRDLQINENGNSRTIKIDIPRGLYTGDVVKYSGMGGTQNPQLPAGDLFVRVNITPPNGYRFEQGSLHTNQSIPLWQALLGTTITIQDPLGGDLAVKVPAGIGTGTILRVAQKGGWIRQLDKRGDILVEIHVIMPQLTQEQQQIINSWL